MKDKLQLYALADDLRGRLLDAPAAERKAILVRIALYHALVRRPSDEERLRRIAALGATATSLLKKL